MRVTGLNSRNVRFWKIEGKQFVDESIICSTILNLAPLGLIQGLVERGGNLLVKCGDFYPWEWAKLMKSDKLLFKLETISHLPGASVYAERIRKGWMEKLVNIVRPTKLTL